MSLRREARERAIQLLFLLDASAVADPSTVFDGFWRQQESMVASGEEPTGTVGAAEVLGDDDRARLRAFAERLVCGVMSRREEIDRRIEAYAENWQIHRMGRVDRNVLRLAVYELFYETDVPPVVIINEAVDLAKYYSSSESGRFVNGLLDRASRDVPRAPRGEGRVQAPAASRAHRKRPGPPPAAEPDPPKPEPAG